MLIATSILFFIAISDRRRVLGRVADDRHEDHADEDLASSRASRPPPRPRRPGSRSSRRRPRSRRAAAEPTCRVDQPCVPIALVVLRSSAVARVQVPVRHQREDQAQHVGQHQDDRDLEAQLVLVRPPGSPAPRQMEDRRDDQPDRAQHQQRRAQARRRPVEPLRLVLEPADERAQPEDQQDVADDRAGDRGLDQRRRARRGAP